MMRASG
jgi:hypothetical protein